MKKVLLIFLLTGLSGCLSHQSTIKTGLEGAPMPSFDLLLADSMTHFNTKSIPVGKPVVLFYFQPWCPYCKAQTETMIEQMQSLKGIRFYMLTSSLSPLFKQFYDHYELSKYPNIIVGIDDSLIFGNYFKTPGVPYLAIYDRDKKLKRVLIGQSDISVIKDIALK
jgi:thiol-disulfide isomerase/thioredoxin